MSRREIEIAEIRKRLHRGGIVAHHLLVTLGGEYTLTLLKSVSQGKIAQEYAIGNWPPPEPPGESERLAAKVKRALPEYEILSDQQSWTEEWPLRLRIRIRFRLKKQ